MTRAQRNANVPVCQQAKQMAYFSAHDLPGTVLKSWACRVSRRIGLDPHPLNSGANKIKTPVISCLCVDTVYRHRVSDEEFDDRTVSC
jgi:hypothetical protein